VYASTAATLQTPISVPTPLSQFVAEDNELFRLEKEEANASWIGGSSADNNDHNGWIGPFVLDNQEMPENWDDDITHDEEMPPPYEQQDDPILPSEMSGVVQDAVVTPGVVVEDEEDWKAAKARKSAGDGGISN
jgi:hypothetical protein